MRFTIRHETVYRYSAPVSLSPHLLRLNPRAEGATILERSLTVDPKPIAFREETDRFGNRVTHLDFEGFSDRLRIESRFDLETVAPEPFADFGAPPLPWAGGLDDPMAQYRSGEAEESAVREFASALASESRWQVLFFLDRLNRTLFARMRHEIRAEGAAWSPERTLAAGGGAFRDVTALFMAACRSLGIAARFVSGRHARRAASPARLARGVPARRRLARLRPDARPRRDRRSCRALRRTGPGGDHADRGRLLRRRRRLDARI